jgi:hypothetical protein
MRWKQLKKLRGTDKLSIMAAIKKALRHEACIDANEWLPLRDLISALVAKHRHRDSPVLQQFES